MNARAEAVARLGGAYDARVLEPSPPAVSEPPWFADDPVGRDDPANGLPRVSPVTGANMLWSELCRHDDALAEWCAERWLGAYRALGPAPAGLAATREALHALAVRVLSPARQRANGQIGLRYTHGGFGTPFFGDDAQLRVRGAELIVQEREHERAAPIDTLASAAAHVGAELLPGGAGDDRPLAIDPAASAFLGDWFGFATSVLEQLRATVPDDEDPSRVQLWPERFDVSVELGLDAAGARAGYGASPGDELHPEPYLYVVPSRDVPAGELWNATALTGAWLPYAEIVAASSSGAAQRAFALGFLDERFVALH